MTTNFRLGTRLALTLSLSIASCLVANVVRAESRQSTRTSVANLSQKIAKLIDLDPSNQDLVISALHRAIASKERATVAPNGEPRPIINGKVRQPQPSPSPIPMIDGMIVKPQPSSPPATDGRVRHLQPSPSPSPTIDPQR